MKCINSPLEEYPKGEVEDLNSPTPSFEYKIHPSRGE